MNQPLSELAQPRRTLSMPGLSAMLMGFALIAMELRYQLMLDRLHMGGRVLLFVCAVSLSVWGLKEIIAGCWPTLGGKQGRRRRHRFMMPLEGWVYAIIMTVLFIGSLLGRSNPLMLVFALMAGPFVMNGWITFTMLRGLSVKRRVPQRAMSGEPFSTEVTLSNSKWWLSAWLMTVRDRVDNGVEFLNPEILFARVPAHGSETGQYQLRLGQRGRYRFGPLQVNSRFPLGLVERGIVLSDPDEILVYPRIGRMSSGWWRQMQSATQLVSHAQARVGSFHDDFHRIREYRSGDEPRSIHWRTTARRNELMVREYRESRDRHFIVLLDAWLPERPTVEDRSRVEYAISLAATIAHDQLRNGRSKGVYFATTGSQFREWGGATGLRETEELLDLLALLRPSSRSSLSQLLSAAHREQTPHSRTVLVTPFAERASNVDWSAVEHERSTIGPLWSDPPQVIVADPAEIGSLFFLGDESSREAAAGRASAVTKETVAKETETRRVPT